MRRRKIIVLLVFAVLVVLGVSLFLYFRPKPLIQEVDSCELSQIVYRGKEITDKTVYEDVLQVLSRYKSRASLETVHSYPTENLVAEINGNDNGKPFHIVLGETNFKYEHAGGFLQKIMDGEDLLDEIEKILQDSN